MGKKTLIFTLIFGIIFVTAILAGANVYQTAMNQKESGHKQAAETAKKEADLKEVDSVETFVGKEKQYIVAGKNQKGEKMYVWVPADNKQKTIFKKAADGITSRQAARAVQDEGLMSTLKEVHLAREGNVLLWEVTYLNQDEQYSLSYVDFINGKIHKNITP
ncbi:cell wall elongation/penicillin-binding protein regulator TseB [Bacillus swezeyi]|uniref:Cell wall elongation regulator TseB-like domain-containing protein n=1 Tax=Bacillus swezeyi TaxID=1925020 RepID=A0A1R1QFW3_9BACI|nr:cell wall elongation/penicillin-binding protein regulator TseB [Bacillus swezeyi]MEC1260563.1 cell wall elongation/penicillin-binding protein regulator TseB [Bacillus swezeyi]MED1740978.1 cell wall elongation/penicillin-binding protein regulator TseB [Bacillus swezeyi]MED2929666.1 cell wall elongation/penicillin-binding protein regulator TseB [Bacillus swezeyi]MED2943585.1 cell wall elongation/penicillin-binding protein regulator TseB [Bacillus swezeyi]MED2963307.1 cell wall elongation/peni